VIIYILRHAESYPKTRSVTDEERRITPRGRTWVKRTVRIAHRELGFEPTVIVSSPLVRAKETADVARRTLRLNSEVIVEECLRAESRVAEVYKRLRKLRKSDAVVLVSHQPLMRNLMADLLGAKSNIWMYQGAISCVQCKSYPKHNSGGLAWLLPPSIWYHDGKWE